MFFSHFRILEGTIGLTKPLPQRIHNVEVHISSKLGNGTMRSVAASDGVGGFLHLAAILGPDPGHG